MTGKVRILALLVVLLVAPASVSFAGVPAHPPGTVCATPQFWCWALYPGPPGTRCACPGPQGRWFQGVLL
jgi:hypothetical protein